MGQWKGCVIYLGSEGLEDERGFGLPVSYAETVGTAQEGRKLLLCI